MQMMMVLFVCVCQQHSEGNVFVGDPVLLQQAGSSAERLKCEGGFDHYSAWSPAVAQGETQGEQFIYF